MKSFREYLHEEDNERLAAGALFHALDTGKYGVALRSKICDQPNTYSPVGGSSDTNDKDLKATVVREVGEEIGHEITPEQLEPLHVFKKKGFQYHTYLCKVPKQDDVQPKLNDENDRFDWFEKHKMPKNLHPGFAETLSKSMHKLP